MFGENLKELRKEAGYTQQEFAKLLGISASAVGMYEQGRREPDHKILLKVAQILEVSVDRLLGEDYEMDLQETIEMSVRALVADAHPDVDINDLNEDDIQTLISAVKLGIEFALRDINEQKQETEDA